MKQFTTRKFLQLWCQYEKLHEFCPATYLDQPMLIEIFHTYLLYKMNIIVGFMILRKLKCWQKHILFEIGLIVLENKFNWRIFDKGLLNRANLSFLFESRIGWSDIFFMVRSAHFTYSGFNKTESKACLIKKMFFKYCFSNFSGHTSSKHENSCPYPT